MATKIKTPKGELRYVFIDGEGRDQAMPGNDPHMQFVCSVVLKKDSAEHTQMLDLIDTEWQAYKEANGLKPAQKPKTNGIKPVLDKESGEETDEVLVTFKTNTVWPNGKDQVVKVFDHKGNDITVAVHNSEWSIGNGSTGVIHGSAVGNDVGGAHKVTLYLTAVQIAKLIKYEGTALDVEEMEGEDIDLGDAVPAIDDNEGPNLD